MIPSPRPLALSLLGVLALTACRSDRTSTASPEPASAGSSTGTSTSTSTTTPATTTSTATPSKDSPPPPDTALTKLPTPDERTADGRAADSFVWRLHKELARDAKGNLFVSPESIRTALAMVYGGARGESARELETLFGYSARSHDVAAQLAREWTELGNEPKEEWRKGDVIVLRTANRLFPQRGKELLPAFLDLTRATYGAAAEPLDFATDTDGARRRINGWVEERTAGRIRDILAPGMLTANTKLVLANAIYFKASWSEPFREESTKPAPFHTPSGDKNVPTMEAVAHRGYAETSDAQIVELPYGREELAMLLVVPKARDGLAALERSLDDTRVAAWNQATSNPHRKVRVVLPKVHIESELSLADRLAKMGAPSVFSAEKADLSGIDGTRTLFLGLVVHKTFVAIDEKGTEAAAATVAAAKAGAAPAAEEPVVVRADHPFLFMIRDLRRHRTLFVGRVVDPSR